MQTHKIDWIYTLITNPLAYTKNGWIGGLTLGLERIAFTYFLQILALEA